MSNVRMTQKNSTADDLDLIQENIARRAYDLFLSRGGSLGDPWADWFAAEREIVRRPAVDILEKDGSFTISASLAGVDPQDVQVDISQQDVVIKAQVQHRHGERDGRVHQCEFRSGRLFRAVHLPRPVDAARARAELRNGVLNVTAPIARDVRLPQAEMQIA